MKGKPQIRLESFSAGERVSSDKHDSSSAVFPFMMRVFGAEMICIRMNTGSFETGTRISLTQTIVFVVETVTALSVSEFMKSCT